MQIFISKRDSFAHNFKIRGEEWGEKINQCLYSQRKSLHLSYTACLNKHTWYILFQTETSLTMPAHTTFFWNQDPYEKMYVCQQLQPKVNLTPSCQNLCTLMMLLTCRCTAPTVTKTHVSRLVHPALCTCAQVCAPVLACTQMHRYSSLGRLHQDAIRRAQKWKAITEAIHLTLSNNFACGRNQNQSQSHIQNPSQFLQRANKDYFIQR